MSIHWPRLRRSVRKPAGLASFIRTLAILRRKGERKAPAPNLDDDADGTGEATIMVGALRRARTLRVFLAVDSKGLPDSEALPSSV